LHNSANDISFIAAQTYQRSSFLFLLLQVVHAMDRTARVTDYRFIKEANGALTITNVMLEDDGKWQCEAENTRRYTENARPVKLVVLGEYPSLTHSPPCTFHFPLGWGSLDLAKSLDKY